MRLKDRSRLVHDLCFAVIWVRFCNSPKKDSPCTPDYNILKDMLCNVIFTMVQGMSGSGGVGRKIDNISTFLLRMNNKIEQLSKYGGLLCLLRTIRFFIKNGS